MAVKKKVHKVDGQNRFKHFMLEDKNHYKMLIGVPKNFDDDVEIFSDNPMQLYYGDLLMDIFKLGKHRKIITSSLNEWIDFEKKKYKIVPIYWEVVLDFILFIYNKS